MESCSIKTSLSLVLNLISHLHYFFFSIICVILSFSSPSNLLLPLVFPSFQNSHQCCISKASINERAHFNSAIHRLPLEERWHFAVGVHCLDAAVSTKKLIHLPTFCILRLLQVTVIFHHHCVGDNSLHIITQGTTGFTVLMEERHQEYAR